MNDHHGIGLYPMYLIERVLDREQDSEGVVLSEKRRIEVCHDKDIKVGDTIEYKYQDLKFVVSEIIDKRDSKGVHNNSEVKWYNLHLEYKNN